MRGLYMQNLTGKIALITGASSGIGEATATALAQNGANLILVARRSERINGLSQKLTAETMFQRLFLDLQGFSFYG